MCVYMATVAVDMCVYLDTVALDVCVYMNTVLDACGYLCAGNKLSITEHCIIICHCCNTEYCSEVTGNISCGETL